MLLARVRNAELTCGSWQVRATVKGVSASLEERAQIGCKRKGHVDLRSSIPDLAKILKFVDNEPKHGYMPEQIRHWM
jgi:hypothetical protein